MPSWTLAGVNLDPYLALDGATPEPLEMVGGDQLAFAGGSRRDSAGRKRPWSARSVPLAGDVAEALRQMVNGQVDAWPFDEDTFSARGLPLTGSSSAAVGTTAVKYGAKALQDGGNRLAFAEWSGALPAGSNWSAMAWRADGPYASPGYRHWLVTSAGGLFVNGAASAVPACISVNAAGKLTVNARDKQEALATWASATVYGSGARISVVVSGTVYIFQANAPGGTSGGSPPTWPTTYNDTVVDNTVTWRNDGRGGLLVDDLVLLPFVVPSSWVSQLHAEHAARAWTAPELRFAGDLVGSSAVTVRGTAARGRGTPHFRSGAWAKTGEVLEIQLQEV